MVIAGDFKNGVTFDMDGQVMQVIEFQHVKPGKGAAFVRTKLKNVITGAVTETTFNPTDKFQDARIDRREMQYLYNDGDLYYFMDMESFEQLPLNADKLSANFKFVKENDMCKIASYNGNVFAVEPPMFVTLEVTATEPGRPRRYRDRFDQAGDRRDRSRGQGSALHQPGRCYPHRHQNRRVSRKSLSAVPGFSELHECGFDRIKQRDRNAYACRGT